jgi:hypothetical protein
VISGKAPPDSQARLVAIAEGVEDPYEPLTGRIEGYPTAFLEALDAAIQVLPRDRIPNAVDWLDRIASKPALKVVPINPASSTADLEGGTGHAAADKREPNPRLPSSLGADDDKTAEIEGRKAKPGLARKAGGLVVRRAIAILTLACLLGLAYEVFGDSQQVLPVDAPADVAVEPGDLAQDPPVPAESSAISPEPAAPAVTDVAPEIDAGAPDVVAPTPLEPVDLPAAEPENAAAADLDDPAAFQPDFTEDIVASLPVAIEPVAIERVVDEPVAAEPASAEVEVVASEELTIPTEVAEPATPEAAPETEKVTEAVSEPEAIADAGPVVSTRPEPQPDPAVLEQQITSAITEVTLPFRTSPSNVTGQFPQISEITTVPDALTQNNWIAEGVIIYAINGEWVIDAASITALAVRGADLQAAPFISASTRIKDNPDAPFRDVTLALPVVSHLTLANGIELASRPADGHWTTVVTVAPEPAADGLRVGDVLISELQSATALNAEAETFMATLERIAEARWPQAVFAVERGGETVEVVMQLARGG